MQPPNLRPSSASAAAAVIRFGPGSRFELQPRERRLLVDGAPATLGGRAFDLLLTLAEEPDRLLGKNELLDRVWPGLVVEEANLHVQISALRKVLGGEVIATVPGRGYRFTATPQLRAPAPPAPAADAAAGRLPLAPGRLFGREADLERLDALLQAPGCVSVVGPGGVGKTRLALAAAAHWSGRRAWVDLGALADGAQLPAALARALGVGLTDEAPLQRLLAALDEGPALLVLDNAEHLVQPVAGLCAQLLAGAAALRVLVTSQIALAVHGERVYRLEPLGIERQASADAPDAGSAVGDAVALLADRIEAADHRFRVTPQALPLLREICLHLDGLPLALEMAAARVPLLGLQGVRDALAQRFALLTAGHRDSAPRHRSLHGALEWSYRLLAPDEQALLRCLGVFAGGFTLDLCVAVAAGADAQPAERWDVVDRLATLVDRSLVAASTDDPPRYHLLETLRAFALERLEAAGESPAAHRRHAHAMLALAEASGTDLAAPVQQEVDNLREAIAWAAEHEIETAARLSRQAGLDASYALWRNEAGRWMLRLEPAIEAAGTALPARLRAQWWTEAARVRILRQRDDAIVTARRALAECRIACAEPGGDAQADRLLLHGALVALARAAVDDGPEVAAACDELLAIGAAPDFPPQLALMTQGALRTVANLRGDYEAALRHLRTERELAQQAGRPLSAEAAETNIVIYLNTLGRHDEALPLARELVARQQAHPNANRVWAWHGLIRALLGLRRLDELQALLPAALDVLRHEHLGLVLPYTAAAASLQGRHEPAARLAGFTFRWFADQGTALPVDAGQLLPDALAAAAAALGADAAARLEAEGRALDADAAIALAVA